MPPKAKAKANPLLASKQSDVRAQDGQGNVYKGFQVWVAVDRPQEDGTLFRKCLVMPGTAGDVFKVKLSSGSEEEFSVPRKMCYNLNQSVDPMTLRDIGVLPHSNAACVLDFLKHRLVNGMIFSTADPLLVILNPFKNLGNATDQVIIQYRDAPDVQKLAPHIFTVARDAVESLHMVRKSQTIVVSGESGAGKTEAVKQVMRYFAAAKSGTMDLRIQTAILAGNPVLEAFGNAKTTRNNNSSRFGRFMQLDVSAAGGINYGVVQSFLLEKSRVLYQEKAERNYHIFYQLLKGATPEMKQQLMLKDLKSYKFINPLCPDAENIDDLAEWADVEASLDSMGTSKEQKMSIFSIVSGVLMLGNVDIVAKELDGVPDAAVIADTHREEFENACKLLYLDPKKTEEGICIKISFAGGNEIRGRWGQPDGLILMQSLCKAMYDKLFLWIIENLNKNIKPPQEFDVFMGMLDIFGFEVFENNSLEQLFINITNEMLQKNFTELVFVKESQLYKDEGISAAELVFTTNKAVISMLTEKKQSLMACLDDQCLAPSSTDEKFLSNCHNLLKGNPKLIKPKVASNFMFLVDHTIGEIQYNVRGFLAKNKDVLRPDLVEVVQASSNVLVSQLFEGFVVERGKMKGDYIGAQFIKQLENLMALINSTEPHFVRCVKPNEQKKPLCFDQAKTLVQLHSLSILEALQLRNLGYSYRRPMKDFIFQFRFLDLGVSQNPNLDEKEAVLTLIKGAKVETGFQMGKTMIFLKPVVAKELVTKQRDAMSSWKPLAAAVESLYKAYEERLKVLENEKIMMRVQAHCRKKIFGKVKAPKFNEAVKGW
eukprot:Lankesteria_metandrocarpae@DN3807_c0_g1_i1.p1